MWIESFKVGNYTDSQGREFEATQNKIVEMTNLYNSKVQQSESNMAPVVKGHTADNEPALGWVERVARRGNKLMAKLINLQPELIDEIKNGRFKKVSISLFPDMMIRHIGLLGAATPAVSGLKNVEFTENEYSEFISDFSNHKNEYLKKIDELNSVIVELQKENQNLKVISNQQENELKAKELSNFVESASANSLITPAQSSKLLDLLNTANNADLSNKNNGVNSNITNGIKEFVSNLKPNQLFREFTHSDFQFKENNNPFDEINTNPDRMEIHNKAMKIKNSIKEITYQEAVLKAMQE